MPCTEEYFYKAKSNKKDGLYPSCKKCDKKKSLEWEKNNYDRHLKRGKKYYEKNKEIFLTNRKTYVEEHKEECYNYTKQYRRSDKGREKYKIYRKKRYNKKHEIYDIEWENCKKYFDYKCAYCGLPIEEHYFPYKDEMKLYDFHKEHVIDEGKNDLRNCIPSCNTCNNQKKTKSLNNWYNISNSNYTYKRYNKIYQWIRYDHKKYIMPKRRYKNQRMTARIKEIENNKIKNIK